MITEKVVLSAAHCDVIPPTDTNKFPYLIGLGTHNISSLFTPTLGFLENKNVVIKQVKDVIKHPEYRQILFLFDFQLFILETPVKLSKTISPVCLPLPEEYDTLEREENILTGFGAHKVWYLEYEKLLGKPLNRAALIPEELMSNESELIDTITEYDFQKNAIEGFFKNYYEMFPGIEKCIDNNYELVCKITNETLDSLIENIKQKLTDSGRSMEKDDVNRFLG